MKRIYLLAFLMLALFANGASALIVGGGGGGGGGGSGGSTNNFSSFDHYYFGNGSFSAGYLTGSPLASDPSGVCDAANTMLGPSVPAGYTYRYSDATQADASHSSPNGFCSLTGVYNFTSDFLIGYKAEAFCPSNSTMSLDQTVCSCNDGYQASGNSCVPNTSCGPNQTRVNGICVNDPGCNPGYILVGKSCVKKPTCKAGADAGGYSGLSGFSTVYLCENHCTVKVEPTACVTLDDGTKACGGMGVQTGGTCGFGIPGDGSSSSSGGSGGGSSTGGDNNGNTGGTGGGGDGSTGGNGGSTGGSGGGGSGDGSGSGTGTGGTGSGGTGGGFGGGTGTGGSGTGGDGSGTNGSGAGGTGGVNGSGDGATKNTGTSSGIPTPKPVTPDDDGTCPGGTHQVSANPTVCIKDSVPPDSNGSCDADSVKVNGKCVYSEPPSCAGKCGGSTGGGSTGSGNGGSGNGGGGDGDSSWGGDCKSGFTCEGDAIQCAISYEQHNRNCQTLENDTDQNSMYNKAVNGTDEQSADKLKGQATQVTVGSFDSSGYGWSRACPADPQFEIKGQTFSIPFSKVCPFLGILSYAAVGITILACLKWVIGGKS